ncbi:MAG: PKD-like domain-containing protein, partial [Bacteroidota bacterium]
EYYYINNASLDYNTQLTQGINATTGSACLFANLNVTNESCTGLANGSATVTPTGGLAPFTYVWSTNPPQTGATATGLTAGNYSVTITSANNISTTIPVSIIVQAPIVTNSSFINGCSGSPLGIVLSGSVPCSFTWTCSNNPNVTGESVGLQTSSIINNTLVNTTNSIQIVTYTVTPKALGTNCTGTPKVITVNVYPKPVMTSAAVGSICSGAPNNFTFTSSFPSSYNWVAADNVNTTGESISLQGGNSITDAIVNNTNSPQNITYTVTPYSGFGSCQGNPQTINITVYPIPLANISPAGNTIDVCDGSTATLTASSAGSYAWYSYDPFTNTNNLISTAQSVVIPSTYSSYYVEVTSNGCSSTSNSVWVNNITTNFGTSITASPQFGATPLNTAFNNNTPNRLNYTYLWSFGDGTTSNSNAATVFHTYSSPGLFDVSLVATSLATGCSDTLTQSGYIFATGGANCTHVATINQGNSVSGCFGSSVSLTCNTNPSYSYQWNINGVAISGATTSSYSAIQSGLYSVTIIENGCPVTSAAISVNFIQAPGLPVIASNGFITPCVGGTVTLTASSSVQNGTYLWSNGVSGTTNIVTNSGTYNVTVTDPATSCSSTSGPFVVAGSSAPAPEICVATVDSLSLNNIIYWDKTNYGPMDTFVVYRDISNNNFMPIGKVSYNSLSEFVDTVRTLYSANGDPNVSSWRYKLSVIDSCGNESPMSPYHQTMFMQSTLGNFSWNHYQVEGQPAPVPALQNYFFNRDNLSNGNWNLIQTLSASSTAFTDPSYNTYQSTGS